MRDAEWVVRRVDPLPDGGSQLTCTGVSELVREREAVFLTRLEHEIKVLDPATTTLVPDTSPAVHTQSALHGEFAPPGRAQRPAHPGGPSRRHGRGAVPARSGPPSVASAAAEDPDRRRCGPRQDRRSGHSRERARRPGPGPAHPGGRGQEHADAVPEGVLEPVHDPTHALGLGGNPAGKEAHSVESQPRSTTTTSRSSRSTRSNRTGSTGPTWRTPGGTSS